MIRRGERGDIIWRDPHDHRHVPRAFCTHACRDEGTFASLRCKDTIAAIYHVCLFLPRPASLAPTRLRFLTFLLPLPLVLSFPFSGVYYDGKWCGSGELLTSYNPTTGKPIARVRQATGDEYEACLKAMEEGKKAWQEVSRP